MDYLSNNPSTQRGGLAGNQNQQSAVNAERKVSQMEIAIEGLSGQHARLEALVGELERRISAVLTPAPPNGGDAKAEGPSSPLANKLFQETALVRAIAERIDSIISRVDL